MTLHITSVHPLGLQELLDIIAPDVLEVEWDEKRRVLYIHSSEGGQTILRACKVKELHLKGLEFPDPDTRDQGSFW